MSVVIYKNGETSKCEVHELQYQLGDGWSITEEEVKVQEVVEDKESDEELEVRAKAKSLGIKSSHNKKLSTLLKEIDKAIENDSD